MLDDDAVVDLVGDLWRLHTAERGDLDTAYGYARGQLGRPDVPDGANDELQQLARLSVKNVISLVVDSFAQNLSVVGYRNAAASENAAAWALWQQQRMDARQAEVHRAALTYGAAYVTATPGGDGGLLFRPRTPRQMIAVYANPQVDAWPRYALETWVDYADTRPHRRGLLLDDEFAYPVDLGELSIMAGDRATVGVLTNLRISGVGDPEKHDAQVCPVVRFINDRDAEDIIVGEVAPLVVLQQAINNVNFDRLVVSRFGAFPQRYVIGWTASPETVLKASMSRVWTFDDSKQDVQAGSFTPASVEPYNALLNEMLEHVAMVAQISPAQVTGKMINLSAEALAAGEANQQRKLKAKRDSFGESWEQLLRLGARQTGDPGTADDPDAEVVWRDTEARSFGAVVDGVTKLAQAGIPIDTLLSLVPGLSQQQITAISERMSGTEEIVAALGRLANTNPGGQPTEGGVPGGSDANGV